MLRFTTRPWYPLDAFTSIGDQKFLEGFDLGQDDFPPPYLRAAINPPTVLHACLFLLFHAAAFCCLRRSSALTPEYRTAESALRIFSIETIDRKYNEQLETETITIKRAYLDEGFSYDRIRGHATGNAEFFHVDFPFENLTLASKFNRTTSSNFQLIFHGIQKYRTHTQKHCTGATSQESSPSCWPHVSTRVRRRGKQQGFVPTRQIRISRRTTQSKPLNRAKTFECSVR